ncbi:hypothetical protein NDR87_27775 [Nocardia sp. CDC159]|uniref:Uncharacterized protein n=1 Tax=Nocardia pulmonis TaxID=2951408 RepID=A0A9X2EBI9_9NOCA|nr:MULTISPECIES: hypothetical protein [Nocardia]MCM6777291.1 hypothetical protein [Nocardia pulmonis]MCM6790176.1 hypothetical protein [Nocardia sp. CDC159]
MATGVGLRIAGDECIAAILTSGIEDAPEPLYIVRESVLHMSDEGDAALGGEPPAGHTHSITGFFEAVGDPAGIPVDEGEAYRAEDLVATALFCLINLAAEHLEGPAEFYATHPGDWPEQQVNALREALDYLGLRAVVLVSEADLPGSEDGSDRGYAHDAARAALAAVLATPAGATPPDPTHTENALVVTDILPALPTPEPVVQAYSAAIPVAQPAETVAVEQTTTAPTNTVPRKSLRRVPVLVAGAVLIGLLLGGLGVTLLFRGHATTPVPPLPDANTRPAPTSTPFVPPVIITTTTPPITTTVEPAPPPPPETTEAPPPPPPPTTTEAPPTTTTPPTSTPARPTRTTPPRRTTPPNPWDPIPGLPTLPGM